MQMIAGGEYDYQEGTTMRRKAAILLVLAMIFSAVASPAFAAELSAEADEIVAAVAIEAAEASVTEEEAVSAESAADEFAEATVGAAEAPSAGGGGSSAEVWGETGKHIIQDFREDFTFDAIRREGNVTIKVAEGKTVTINGGISGDYLLRKFGEGTLEVYGVCGSNGASGDIAGKGEDAVCVKSLMIAEGFLNARGGDGGDGAEGGTAGDGGNAVITKSMWMARGASLQAVGGFPGSVAIGGEGGTSGLGVQIPDSSNLRVDIQSAAFDLEGNIIFENGDWAEAFAGEPVVKVCPYENLFYVWTGADPLGTGFVCVSEEQVAPVEIPYYASDEEEEVSVFSGEPVLFWESAPGHTFTVTPGPKAGYSFVKYQVDAGDREMFLDNDGIFDMPAADVTITGVFESYPEKKDLVTWGEAGKSTEITIEENVVFEKGVQLAGNVILTVAEGAEAVIKEGLQGEGYDFTLKSGNLVVCVSDGAEMAEIGSQGPDGSAGAEGADGANGTNGRTALVCKELTVESGYLYAEGEHGGSGGNGGKGGKGGDGGNGGDAVVADKVIVKGGYLGTYGGEAGKTGSNGMDAEGWPKEGQYGRGIVTEELVIPDDYYIRDVHDIPGEEVVSWAETVSGVQEIRIRPFDKAEAVTVVQDPADSAVITLYTTNGTVEAGTKIAPGHRVTFDVQPLEGAAVDWDSCSFTYDKEDPKELPLIEEKTFLMPQHDVRSAAYPVTLSFKLITVEKKSEAKPVESEVKIEEKNEEEKAAVQEIVENKADQTEALKTLEESVDYGELVADGLVKPGSEVVQSFDIKLKDVALNQTEEKKIVFEIKPVMTVKTAGQQDKQIVVGNKYLKKTVKVVVPVPASIKEKYVKVKHIADDGTEKDIVPYPEIRNAGTANANFEIEVEHFSTFEVGFTDEQYVEPEDPEDPEIPVQPSWSGSSGASSAKLFTGVPGSPVTGTWSTDAAGNWHFATSAMFRNTWGYIVNPYAPAGLPKEGWFWFDWNGNMLNGWQLIGGKWYYLNPKHDGTFGMCQLGGVTPDGYKLNADGSWAG